jgi:cyclic pyranopterin phosphate synthase
MDLRDPFGRRIEYLRLSVTDRFDLRCSYCLPEGFCGFERQGHWLDFDEIERVVRLLAALGVRRVRLTGGEPLLRRGLPDLARRLAQLPGIDDLSLSTNATQLARHAQALRVAGVIRVNVSLDSLRRERLRAITGRDVLDAVHAGLIAAKAAGFVPIKINMVVLGGVNDDEVEEMAAFCIDRGFVLRLIEQMPLGEMPRPAAPADLGALRRRLQDRFGLVDGLLPGGGPARYLVTPDGTRGVGFITPLSQHFCATCNRVRLSVDGTLHLCLGQEQSLALRPLLRGGVRDAELVDEVRHAVNRKPKEHAFGRAVTPLRRFMAQTGG